MNSSDSPEGDATFRHSKAVYEEMLANSRLEQGDETQMVVYEGNLTTLIIDKEQGLGLAMPNYTKTTQVLKALGCIRQLRRGGGTSPSLWELVAEPTLEEYQKYVDTGKPRSATAMMTQQIRDLSGRLAVIEQVLKIPAGAKVVE